MRPMFRSLAFFKADGWRIAAMLFVIAMMVTISLLQAWPTAVLVDTVLSKDPQTQLMHRAFLYFLPDDKLWQVVGLALIGLFLKCCQDFLGWLRLVLAKQVETNAIRSARSRVYEHLQSLGPAYQKTQPSGDSVYRVSTDVSGLGVVQAVSIDIIVAVMTLFIMTSIMLTRNVPLTLFAMSIAPLLLVNNFYFARKVEASTRSAKEAESELNNTLIRSISGLSIVQLFGQRQAESSLFNRWANASANRWVGLAKRQCWHGLVVQVIFSLAGAVIFGYGGYLAWRDQFAQPVPNGFTVGDVMVFMIYLGQLWDPLARITSATVAIKPGLVGMQRVFAVLDVPLQVVEKQQPTPLPLSAKTLKFSNVSFSYQGVSRDALADVSFTIGPDQFVALIGESGSGKSTILNLLPRFYDVRRGAITLGGMDIREVSFDDLRQHFAFATQDSMLLPGTISDNIRYSRPDATAQAIRQAAIKAGADQFITEMPEGYDSPVGENGGVLSGGQRQRIALARALLSPAPILVLDEPTSALDPLHEDVIAQTISEERRKRAVILVTHRIKMVHDCDQIIVLSNGRVVQQGNHRELSTLDGNYRDLLQREAG